MPKDHRIVALVLLILLAAPVGTIRAEWRDGFEDYAAGQPLNGQSHWRYGRPERPDQASAVVTEDETVRGQKALAVFRDNERNRVFFVQRTFKPFDGVVWVEAHIKPGKTRTAVPALTLLAEDRPATHTGFAADGREVVFSTFARSYWRVFRDFPTAEARWYRLTQRIDFEVGTWSLWVDGALHSHGVPLLSGARQLSGLRVTAGGTRDDPALIDELSVGRRKPDDIDVPPLFPPREEGHLFRFAVFGDPQIGFGAPRPPFAMDTARYEAAIDQAERAGCQFVLLTGDLVHKPSEAAYRVFLNSTQRFGKMPWYPVPGNHDPDPWYRKYIREELDYAFEHEGFTFIGMKTWTPDHQGGVTEDQLDWLEERLRRAGGKDHEIILWCHVTPYGPNPRGEWVRDGGKRMLALCRKYRVLAVMAGHFHRRLWHFEQDGTHHVVAPGLTRSRGELGWVLYDVYADRVVQSFKPLWNGYAASGEPEGHIVHGPLVLPRRRPAER